MARFAFHLASIMLGSIVGWAAHPALGDVLPSVQSPSSSGRARGNFTFERFTLKNGLEVILHEDHRLPRVSAAMVHRMGSRDDPPGRRGMAELIDGFLRHPSTRHVMQWQREDMFQVLGLDPWEIEGGAGADYITSNVTVPSQELPLLLWFESDRLGFAADGVDPDTLKRGLDALVERMDEAQERPYFTMFSAADAGVFATGHPYRNNDLIQSGLLSADVEQVKAHLRTCCGPSNTILAVGGDLDLGSTKALVDKYFGSLPSSPKPATRAPNVTFLSAEKRIEVEANVARPALRISWQTPNIFQPEDIALDGTARLLTLRLFRRLVQDQKMVMFVIARQQSKALASNFSVHALIEAGYDTAAVLRVIDEELDKLRNSDPTTEEVKTAKMSLLSTTSFQYDELDEQILQFATFSYHTGDPGFLSRYIAGYEALTTTAIREVTQKYLLPQRRVVVRVTPNRSATMAGRVVGSGSP